MQTRRSRVGFNTRQLEKDMALKGLTPAALARLASVSDMTAYRFLDGTSQSTKTANKFATALGKPEGWYLVFHDRARARQEVSA